MSAIEEDDDAFLYGEEEEVEVASKKQKLEANKEQVNVDSEVRTEDKSEDGSKEEDDEEEGDDDDDEEEDEDDSDSDIEFIIGSEEKTDSTTQDTTATTTAPIITSEALDEVNDTNDLKPEAPQTTDATITRVPDIDINKVGEFQGKPITSINLQDLKEKPWRQPGADTSEYFNYGFDEFTWTAYCAKQDKTRTNFNPQKLMMSMMPMGIPPLMMGLPGGLPGGIPGGLPGGNVPFPTGLPPMPQPPIGNQQSQDSNKSTPQLQQAELNSTTQPITDLPQAPVPQNQRFPTAPSFNKYNNQTPRGPSGRERDFRDKAEYERENKTGYNNDYRDRGDRRPRYRGGRR